MLISEVNSPIRLRREHHIRRARLHRPVPQTSVLRCSSTTRASALLYCTCARTAANHLTLMQVTQYRGTIMSLFSASNSLGLAARASRPTRSKYGHQYSVLINFPDETQIPIGDLCQQWNMNRRQVVMLIAQLKTNPKIYEDLLNTYVEKDIPP